MIMLLTDLPNFCLPLSLPSFRWRRHEKVRWQDITVQWKHTRMYADDKNVFWILRSRIASSIRRVAEFGWCGSCKRRVSRPPHDHLHTPQLHGRHHLAGRSRPELCNPRHKVSTAIWQHRPPYLYVCLPPTTSSSQPFWQRGRHQSSQMNLAVSLRPTRKLHLRRELPKNFVISSQLTAGI